MRFSRVPEKEEDDDHVDAYDAFLRSLNENTDDDSDDEDDDDRECNDEVSAADLDLRAHPLPAVPHAVLAVVALLLSTVFLAAALSLVAWVVFGGIAAAVVGIVASGPTVWLVVVMCIGYRTGNSDRGLLKLERQAHPRFFTVFDAMMRDIGVVDVDVYLVACANAHYGIVDGRTAVILGYGCFAPYSMTAFRSTMGHELGHAVGGDAKDFDAIAFMVLQYLATRPWAVRRLGRFLRDRARHDAMRRSRLREHAADFWGGMVAGAGTTERCLVEDRRSALLWDQYNADIDVLVAAGYRPQSFAALYHRAVAIADECGFGVRPSSASTNPLLSHPCDRARAEVAEGRLLAFKNDVVVNANGGEDFDDGSGGVARALLDDAVGVGEEVIELAIDADGGLESSGLVVVDNFCLWAVYASALRPRFRALVSQAFAIPTNTPLLKMLPLLRLRAEAGGRWFLHQPDDADADEDGFVDASQRVMSWFLDLLGDEGLLVGTRHVGAMRGWRVGGDDQFALTLSLRLSMGQLWDELETTVCAARFMTPTPPPERPRHVRRHVRDVGDIGNVGDGGCDDADGFDDEKTETDLCFPAHVAMVVDHDLL